MAPANRTGAALPASHWKTNASLLVAMLAALIVVTSVPADAKREPDSRARQEEVRRQRAKVASQLNVLRASDAEIQRALDALDSNVRLQERAAADARQAAEAAALSATTAREDEARTAGELAELKQSMKTTAVDAYTRGATENLSLALDSASFSEMARRQQMVDFANGRRGEVADQLRATRFDLVEKRQEAEEAEQRARGRRTRAEARLDDVKDARGQQLRVADSVEQRVEAALAEADSLASLDKALAADISRRQEALARRIATRATPRGGGSQRLGSVSVTTVRGIVINSGIASRLEALLGAAEADGVPLSGAGYRSSDGQVAARRSNCGSSNYDIYQKPASQCRPPTARPGQSMHEQGLAIDFTHNGRILSRGSPGYQWLARSAGRFGLSNLPAEAWHWSTSGN